jgi:CRISPR-associated protein Csb2
MTLILEIEFLAGVSFAAIGPDSESSDWPPQPDRVFSALVASWALRGQSDRDARALEWLETLPSPRLVASAAESRTSVVVFVPPNDPRSNRQKHARGVLPALRSRQPRRFQAVRPHDAVVRFVWTTAEPESTTFAALNELARDTAYVGHSTSLTRCRFLLDPEVPHSTAAVSSRQSVYRGRFAELRRDFDAGRRPRPGMRVAQAIEERRSDGAGFESGWLLLEHIGGDMPDLRAAAIVTRVIRDALMSGYQRTGHGGAIPEVVSGHRLDGTPSRQPHLAIIPLPFAGFPYADGHVLGFALVVPRGSDILRDEAFREALRTIAPLDHDLGRRVVTLKTKPGTDSKHAFAIDLSPTIEPSRRSIDRALYTSPAVTFGTVTPIVLDRHLKESGDARQGEIASQIAVACRHIGLPEPEAIFADKHSTFEGVPSAYPSPRSPHWMRWRMPSSLASRQMTHAVIRFAAPVNGPVILGAGRFVGLGLCRPLDGDRS